MSTIIDGSPHVVDIMADIAEERKRLKSIVNSSEYHKNKNNWRWMEDWLSKSDVEHFKDWFWGTCNVCGKRDRFFLKMFFSFCNEGTCSIQICKKCLRKMQKILNTGIKEKISGGVKR